MIAELNEPSSLGRIKKTNSTFTEIGNNKGNNMKNLRFTICRIKRIVIGQIMPRLN